MNARRVLGTVVALILIGSALGMLGALVFPEKGTYPARWRDADRRPAQSPRQKVRPNSLRRINPTIKVVAHCKSDGDNGALHAAHYLDRRPFIAPADGRRLPLVQARCDEPKRRGTGRL
jgi:hypothetical protein